jgi:hypothetical protein
MEFKNLNFSPRMFGDGWGCQTQIGNYVLSVQAGEGLYCSPRANLDSPDLYKTFEVAVWESGDSQGWATQMFFPENGDDVVSNVTRKQITELMKKMEMYGTEK